MYIYIYTYVYIYTYIYGYIICGWLSLQTQLQAIHGPCVTLLRIAHPSGPPGWWTPNVRSRSSPCGRQRCRGISWLGIWRYWERILFGVLLAKSSSCEKSESALYIQIVEDCPMFMNDSESVHASSFVYLLYHPNLSFMVRKTSAIDRLHLSLAGIWLRFPRGAGRTTKKASCRPRISQDLPWSPMIRMTAADCSENFKAKAHRAHP